MELPNNTEIQTRVYLAQVFDEEDWPHVTEIGFTPEAAYAVMMQKSPEDVAEAAAPFSLWERGEFEGDATWTYGRDGWYWTIRSKPLHTAPE